MQLIRLRKSIDGLRYRIRFTPRRPGSKQAATRQKRLATLIADSAAGRTIK